jgi:hypothetical protein
MQTFEPDQRSMLRCNMERFSLCERRNFFPENQDEPA